MARQARQKWSISEGVILQTTTEFAAMTRTMAGVRAAGAAGDGGRGGRSRIVGYEFKINKKKEQESGVWKTVRPGTNGSEADSFVHRYAREIGFQLPEHEHGDTQTSATVAHAVRQLNALAGEVKNRVKGQGDFECFVLRLGDHLGEQTQYLGFLQSIMVPFDMEGNLKTDRVYEQVKFNPPTASLVTAWLLYLRNERNLSFGSIDCLLSGLSSTNGHHAGSNIDRKKMSDLLKQWKESDSNGGRTKQAPAFDICKDLPNLFKACFKIRGWNYFDSVVMWAAFLIMMAAIGRSSCMSTYCPKIEHIEFPSGPAGYDRDRMPKRMYIAWTNWKSRKNRVGEKYYITIERNYTDQRFCPVFWLSYMLTLKQRSSDVLQGPLFPYKDSRTFASRLKTLFNKAGLTKCSSHSVWRTAAQWAIRCGCDTKHVVDVGHWLDYNEVRKDIGQGDTAHQKAVEDSFDGKDPVGRVWFFRSAIRSTVGGEFHRA